MDTFDNSVACQAVQDACRRGDLSCLPIGLASGYAATGKRRQFTLTLSDFAIRPYESA